MLNFQQKWKAKTFMYSPWVRLVLFVCVMYSLFSVYIVYQKKLKSEEDVLKAQKVLLELSSKNVSLINDIDHLQTDEGLEAEIRNKYSVAKDNEQVVILVENPVSTDVHQAEKLSIWGKLRKFIGL